MRIPELTLRQYPTWQESPEMVIQSVKMWQQKGYNGC